MTIRGYLNSIQSNKTFVEEYQKLLSISEIVSPEKALEKEMQKDILESALRDIGVAKKIKTYSKDELEDCIFIKKTKVLGHPYALIIQDGNVLKVPEKQVIGI